MSRSASSLAFTYFVLIGIDSGSYIFDIDLFTDVEEAFCRSLLLEFFTAVMKDNSTPMPCNARSSTHVTSQSSSGFFSIPLAKRAHTAITMNVHSDIIGSNSATYGANMVATREKRLHTP